MKMDNRKNEHLCLGENIWSRMGDEIEPMIQRADAACRNQFVFTHPWDMEYCDDPITFTGKIDWTYCYKGDPEWAFMINRKRFMAELGRSEEHTSELQSRFDLVCRLLLEKKK